MENKRKIYKLICVLDNTLEKEVYGGNIKDIDDFIKINNINSIEDLCHFFNINDFEALNKIEFKIVYKNNKVRKEKALLYKDEIEVLNNKRKRNQLIEQRYLNDKDFMYDFLLKFVEPKSRINKDFKIKNIATKLCKNPKNLDLFKKFIQEYIKKKTKLSKEDLNRFTPSELAELNETDYKIITTNYSALRDIYTFSLNKDIDNIKTVEQTKFSSGNEFDELIKNDQNPDMGIRYPKYCTYNIKEENEDIEKFLNSENKKSFRN